MHASSPTDHQTEERDSQVPGGEENDTQRENDEYVQPWSPRIVYMRAAIEQLASPLIPFAVLKDDPLLSFYAGREARRQDLQAENAAEVVEEIWNAPFAELTSAQQYFLVAWSAVPGVSPRVATLAELAIGIATPGPYYKRWIATRAIDYQGEPVAWCVEINMLGTQEEIIEIVLAEESMLRLLPLKAERTNRVA